LGDAEAEYAKLAMDPRRTPEKVLTGHPCDQIADLTGNPGTSTSPAATRSISPNPRPAVTAPTQHRIGLNDHQAFAPTSPPARQQNPKQSINATEARAPGSATFQHGNLVAQRDRFQPQRGASEVRFGRPGSLRLAALPSTVMEYGSDALSPGSMECLLSSAPPLL